MKYEMTIPAGMLENFNKMMTKAAKNINGMSWSNSEEYSRTYRHYFDGKIVKMSHRVVDVVFEIPEQNNWMLVATVIEGALFVTDQRHELKLINGHGVDYNICDACKHHQKKKSFIVRNTVTGEELQIGSECAKKFGIGLMNSIHKLTNELYASYMIPVYDGDEPVMWPAHISDPHAVKSVETSIMVQAAKKYYDDHNGVWKKGYYTGSGFTARYVPSESNADLRAMVDNFTANKDDAYYKELCEYLNNTFEADEYSEFSQTIKSVGYNFYMSLGDTAAVFFAVKNYEIWKKEQYAKENKIYLPKRLDYIKIEGKIVNKIKKNGYFGEYYEYEILNNIDNIVYKRAGTVNPDENGNVSGFAIIDSVYNGNYILGRVTKNKKKNMNICNIF